MIYYYLYFFDALSEKSPHGKVKRASVIAYTDLR